ncbi:hypothetical protein C8F04DRAFT_514076 [Mycena alexandri]|uniref:Uncharacterized protein n=1 Tax=Mycena alexandri TaxID=1745969 RepID=A0AAD6SXH5_9AGAR|nr:hypothetical protein C8F04DRAFT_514076 [Mycena alexandri]
MHWQVHTHIWAFAPAFTTGNPSLCHGVPPPDCVPRRGSTLRAASHYPGLLLRHLILIIARPVCTRRLTLRGSAPMRRLTSRRTLAYRISFNIGLLYAPPHIAGLLYTPTHFTWATSHYHGVPPPDCVRCAYVDFAAQVCPTRRFTSSRRTAMHNAGSHILVFLWI